MLEKLKRLTLSDAEVGELTTYYNKYKAIPLPTREDFSEYSRTGSRLGYENKYFARRHRVNALFMLWHARGGLYLDKLRNELYAVCGEETWALPAHITDLAAARTEIDLFAAETAMMLAEILYLTESALGLDLENRIKSEIRERIFDPFSKNAYHWEIAEHNWAAVCAGAVGIAYMRLAPDELPLERILGAMNAYISGYNDDGICLEGIGYWSYGFGFYIYFADTLAKTRGIDIIRSDKLRRIAEFPQSSMLCGDTRVTCSDAPEDFRAPEGLMGMLREYYGTSPAVKTEKTDECGRWAHFIRSYLYPYSDGKNAAPGEFVFPKSQWYVNRGKSYGFFIKGGANDEPHNHNDIGSFIIARKSGQLLCDIGAGEYTKDYFNDKTRYDYLCNSSFGHSVPIIDGQGQRAGHCDRFECGSNRALVSFGGAYGGGITLIREIRLYENKITLRDSFKFADERPHTITERFVTEIEPVIDGDETIVGTLRINRAVAVKKEIIRAHNGTDKIVYLLDIRAGSSFDAEISIE